MQDYDKLKCRFSYIFIMIKSPCEEVIKIEIEIKLKEVIRLNIKPNFTALAKEYGCDPRTIKKKQQIEKLKELGIEIEEKTRNHLIDEYMETIDRNLESIPGIKAMSIYYF